MNRNIKRFAAVVAATLTLIPANKAAANIVTTENLPNKNDSQCEASLQFIFNDLTDIVLKDIKNNLSKATRDYDDLDVSMNLLRTYDEVRITLQNPSHQLSEKAQGMLELIEDQLVTQSLLPSNCQPYARSRLDHLLGAITP